MSAGPQTKTLRNGLAIAVAGLLGGAAAGCNIYEPFGDDESTESLIEEGRQALDRGEWNAAIAVLEEVGSRVPGRRDVQSDLASAYSGRAGLNFIKLGIDLARSNTPELDAEGNVIVPEQFVTGIIKRFQAVNSQSPDDLERAIEILDAQNLFPKDRRSEYVDTTLQIALVQVADFAALPIVRVGNTRTLYIGPDDAARLSDPDAERVYSRLRQARDNLAAVIGGSAPEMLSLVDETIALVDSIPAATNAERVRLYLGKKPSLPTP